MSSARHRIVFALPHPSFGGAERLAALISRRCAELDMRVGLLIASSDPRLPESTEAWFSAHCQIGRVTGCDPAPETLDFLVRLEATALVVCGRSPIYDALPAIASARPDLRIVVFQFNAQDCIAENRRARPYLDVLIAESLHAAETLDPDACLSFPIRIISSGIDARRIAARPLPPRASRPTIAFIGRFDKAKNPFGFVRMVARLPTADAHFLMIGDGTRMARTRALARSLRIAERIKFTGLLSDSDLEDSLDRVDILVVPSLIDGRPLVIQEAMARGVAVVATATGAIPELVEDSVTGFLCAPHDDAMLAARVGQLIMDSTLRERFGQEGRRRLLASADLDVSLARYLRAITGDEAMFEIAPISCEVSHATGSAEI